MAKQIKLEQPTHTGIVRHRVTGRGNTVKLQESAHYWVTMSRAQYRKTDGKPKGCGPDPLWSLDLDSVKLIGGLG